MARRILLVDDEPTNISLLQAFLRPDGYDIVTASRGVDALQMVEQGGIDLVLLDVRMPGLDGIDVLVHLRARADAEYLPVVLLTAHGDRELRLRALQAGADDFIEKPIDRAILGARVRNLLQLKEQRDELARRNRDLEELQRQQRDLTNFIVHDLRNPLGAVHSNVQYLQDALPREGVELHEALDDAEAATSRLLGMVSDLLWVARLEQPEFPLHPEAVSLRGMVQEIGRLMARSAERHGVHLQVEVQEDVRVRADAALVLRVLENLCDNAMRHTPRGGRVQVSTEPGPMTQVKVGNTGRPIPEALRGRIFDKFVRGPESRAVAGAGLGLYFCRRVAEAHGGRIDVVDTPEWPTVFRLHLPAA